MSTATLMELYQLFKDDKTRALQIQKELVAGVGTKTKRAAIAKAWAEALRLTEAEAKRRAD